MTLTAAEQKTLDDIAAAEARGEDPFGDEDTTTTDSDEGQAHPESGGIGEASIDQVDDANLQAVAEATAHEALAELNAGPDPLQFNAQVPTDYKTARAALLAEKAEAMGKLMDGELDAKEYAAIETRVMDSLEDLSAQRIRAETLMEANAQTQAQAQRAVITSLVEKAKDQVPYATDAKAQRQFDMAMQQVGADPDNAGKPFAHLVHEAHKVVLALRGVQAKPEAQRKPGGTAPVTLRSIPAAQTPNTGGSITDQLARLSGQEYEAAYAKLTPQQRAAMLDD